MSECASSILESRVVPLRLMPTMKIGESVEDSVPFEIGAIVCSSSIKIPHPLADFHVFEAYLFLRVSCLLIDRKAASRNCDLLV